MSPTRRIYEELVGKRIRTLLFATHLLLGVLLCTGVTLAVWFVSMPIDAKTGVGNLATTELFQNHTALFAVLGLCLVTPLEEIAFRLLPRVLFVEAKSKRAHWRLGVAVSLVFGFAHLSPVALTLPVPAFVLGLSLWFMQWRHGYFGTLCLHFAVNAILYLIAAQSLG